MTVQKPICDRPSFEVHQGLCSELQHLEHVRNVDHEDYAMRLRIIAMPIMLYAL